MEKRPHERLVVWNGAIELVKDVYLLTREFPGSEMYGLTSQLRRAAVSIATNIAEGASRQTTKEYIQFLYISRGSLSEIDTLLCVSERLNLIDSPMVQALHKKAQSIAKMLTSLIRSLKR